MQVAQQSGHFCHAWATEFHLQVASWESLAVARPLWETGLWAADTGRQGSRCRLSRAPYCWGGVSRSTGTGRHGRARGGVHSIHASGLTTAPVKVRSRDKTICSIPLGQPSSPSVLEGVASFLCLLLLCSQRVPVHLLQWVVHVVPVEVPVPLCPGAQEQGHVDGRADQQQEN